VTVILTFAAPAGGDGNQSATTSRVIFLPTLPPLRPGRINEVLASEALPASSNSILMPESVALVFCNDSPVNCVELFTSGMVAERYVCREYIGCTRPTRAVLLAPATSSARKYV